MKKILIAFGCMAFMSSCTVSHSISCTNNPVGSKVGMVKTKLFGDQDLSYETACKNGNITKVGTAIPMAEVIVNTMICLCRWRLWTFCSGSDNLLG